MKLLLSSITSVILGAAMTFAVPTIAKDETPKLIDGVDKAKLESILNSSHRTAESKERDEFRHPKEVFSFFDIKPTDKVLEVWPGNGWYTEILGPYLKEDGELVAATFSTMNQNSSDKRKAFWSKVALEYREKVSDTDIYGDITFTELDPPEALKVAEPNSVDLALIIRSLHIWDENGDLLTGLQAVFDAIKPGGTLGIIQHRADSISDISAMAAEGYLGQDYVISAAQKIGFQFVDSSEVNSNPRDTKDYPRGVYTLPPTLAMGALDQDLYLSIGESDRMTLKFIKPLFAGQHKQSKN